MSIIHFVPVAGPTIEEAVESAIKMSKASGKTVIADINDVVMVITAKTNKDAAIATFRDRLQFKYEIEKIRKEQNEKTR